MAKLRRAVAYRRLERPYTRKSRYKKKNYVRATPVSKIVRYDMGDLTKEFPLKYDLVSKSDIQIRHNAIESARLTAIRLLEKKLGKNGFNMRIKIYPHHILRENPLATGAGADRMSTGMKMSFGKPIGIAARVMKEQTIISLSVNPTNEKTAKLALKRASYKLPCSCRIEKR